MITTKQRAFLRSLANTLDPIFQIGKGGINQNLITSIDQALETRELIKISILDNSESQVRESCDTIANALNAESVQCIGRKFVIYRESKENKRIELPR